ncbi:MAG: glycosyltransferase, partial [Planctomycetaceae bacterium]|nr:glycosyltransferase [Planctomycetaceae bacterium]
MVSVGISVVVPVYAGAETLSEMVREFSSIKREWENRFPQIELLEVVFVDDDSVDHSSAVLSGLETRHSWIRVLTLSRNFGQHPATVAGILTTSGEWVVTMDEDLQHPPSKIFDLLKTALDAGNDVVYAKSTVNVHDSFLRDWSSRFVKKLTSWLSGNQQVVDFSSFRLVRGSIARAAAAVSANETYFDVALSWFTSGIGTLSLELRDERFRQRRQSGYSLRRLISHARRLLISSQ